jgi:hypothetical protein
MNLLLKIVESGSGREFTVGTYPTLEQCSKELEELDHEWCHTPKVMIDDLPDSDPLRHYEGCDAYATDEDGNTYSESFGEWERDN